MAIDITKNITYTRTYEFLGAQVRQDGTINYNAKVIDQGGDYYSERMIGSDLTDASGQAVVDAVKAELAKKEQEDTATLQAEGSQVTLK